MPKSARETGDRIQSVSTEEFVALLHTKQIRPASLDDVQGTHHKRALYKHPNTGQFYVKVNGHD